MQWLLFGFLATLVTMGVRKMMREGQGLGTEPPVSSFHPSAHTAPGASDPKQIVQDTVQCTVCHAYVVKSAARCGRDDCPYPPAKGDKE